MRKEKFLEQLKRFENLDKDEIKEYNELATESSYMKHYWVHHMRGHVLGCDELEMYCRKEDVTMKDIKKYIKKSKQKAKANYKEIEPMYLKEEEIPTDLEEKYAFYEGIECFLNSVSEIARGNKYISKEFSNI